MTENYISPTFDPSDNTWYTDDGIEAKSLAELQRKLPDVHIECYYPKGYGHRIPPRAAHVVKVAGRYSKPVFKPEIEEELAAPLELPRFLLASNKQEEESTSTPRLKKQRASRSQSLFGKIDWKDLRNIDKLRLLVFHKLTSTQIAKKFDCSRNAIIGACQRLGIQLQGRGSGKRKLRARGEP